MQRIFLKLHLSEPKCLPYLAVFLGVLILTQPVNAQLNLNVPEEDPAYEQLRLLLSSFSQQSEIFSTKPLSRGQFSRAILLGGLAYKKSSQIRQGIVPHSLLYLAKRFRKDLKKMTDGHTATWRLQLFERMKFDFINLKGKSRPLPNPRIDAILQPFTRETADRKIVDGQNVAFESSHWLAAGNFASVFYQGRLLLSNPRSKNGLQQDLDYETLRLHVIFSMKNLNLLIGKDSMVWGPGAGSNLSLSGNAAPIGSFQTFPLVKLSNRRPVKLPWVFKGLGPMRFVVFISQLEKNRRDFNRPWYIGQRLNFKPGKTTEFGLSHTFILGGKNFPSSFTFWDALAEFFFIRIKQNFIFNKDFGEIRPEDNIGNHFMGVDFSKQFPGLRFSNIYGEIYTEDVHFNYDRSIHDNVGFHGGIYIPNLLQNNKVSLRLEGTHTPSLFYVGSAPFLSGQVFNQKILGNNLGPAGNEFFLKFTYRPNKTISIAVENRFQSRGVGKHATPEFIGAPNEKRYEVRTIFRKWINDHLNMKLDLGYERVIDFNHSTGKNQNDYFTGLSMKISR